MGFNNTKWWSSYTVRAVEASVSATDCAPLWTHHASSFLSALISDWRRFVFWNTARHWLVQADPGNLRGESLRVLSTMAPNRCVLEGLCLQPSSKVWCFISSLSAGCQHLRPQFAHSVNSDENLTSSQLNPVASGIHWLFVFNHPLLKDMIPSLLSTT